MLLPARCLALPAALACLLTIGGCQSAKVAQPLTASLAGNDTSSQMDFWHTLETRPVVSNDEAFHALLLDINGKDDAKDYPGRIALLKSRHLLPGGFHEPPNYAIQRGDLAVALVGIMHIKGGLMMHLVGPMPRYATRELVYIGFYPMSSEHQTFSGAEFLGLVGRAEDYQKNQGKSS